VQSIETNNNYQTDITATKNSY